MYQILVPTDFSDHSRKALDWVFTQFDPAGIKVHLLHTIKAPHSASGVLIRIDDLMRRDAEMDMANLVNYVEETYNITPENSLHLGHLSDWISTHARARKLDLIVMGTLGAGTVTNRIMGSVTESVIRNSQIPVAAIPPSVENQQLGKMVIALGREQLPHTEILAGLLDHLNGSPEVTVLRVVKKLGEESRNPLILRNQELKVEVEENNSVVNGINSYLAANETDLLCLFHKHNSRLDYLFNRSVTKNIGSHVSVPLLSVPDHA